MPCDSRHPRTLLILATAALVLTLLLPAFTREAAARDRGYSAGGSRTTTSDGFTLNRLDLGWTRAAPEAGWTPSLQATLGSGESTLGIRYAFTGVRGIFSASRSVAHGLEVGFHLGFHALATDRSRTLIPAGIRARLSPGDRVTMDLSARQDLSYFDVLLQPDAVISGLAARSLEWSGVVRASPILRAGWHAALEKFSDGNTRSLGAGNATSLFRLLRLNGSAGVKVVRIGCSSPSFGYWSPAGYFSIGPRADFSYAWSTATRVAAGAEILRFSQDLEPWAAASTSGLARSAYLRADIEFAPRQSLAAFFDWQGSDRPGLSWERRTLGASLHLVF